MLLLSLSGYALQVWDAAGRGCWRKGCCFAGNLRHLLEVKSCESIVNVSPDDILRLDATARNQVNFCMILSQWLMCSKGAIQGGCCIAKHIFSMNGELLFCFSFIWVILCCRSMLLKCDECYV